MPRLWALLRQAPNALTVARVVAIPAFTVLLVTDHGQHRWAAGALFAAAAMTDQADGVLARRWQAESVFGKVADPLADKLLIGTAITVLALRHDVAWLVIGLLAARHLLYWALRMLWPRQGMLSPTWLGKLCAWVLYTSLGLMIFAGHGGGWAARGLWAGVLIALGELARYSVLPLVRRRPVEDLGVDENGQSVKGPLGVDEGVAVLGGGRRLAYCTAGPPDGIPVFFFHGWGESRFTIHPDLSIVGDLGIRLIAVDRPGTGRSDPQRGRTLLDWPADVAHLADQLGLGAFSVVGHSGGGPYVAACAYRMPERVASAAIVSGVAPPAAKLLRPLMKSEFWKVSLLLVCAPGIGWPLMRLGIWLGRPHIPRLLSRHVARLAPADQAVMADPAMREMRITSMLEAFRQGAEGLYEDALLLRRGWGFRPESVSMPVRVWHGEADRIVNIAFGQELARRLPGSRPEFRPDLGHNMLFSHWGEILRTARDDAQSGAVAGGRR